MENDIQMWPKVSHIPRELRLPSCSTIREDLLIWTTNDETAADNCKVKMENSQRHDRKLREKDHTYFEKRDVI